MAVVTQTMQDQVTELYLGFFGRAPDAAGFGYWTEKLANGTATVEGIANGFSNTPEFVANYGGLTPVQQVTKIYLNVLNRAPDAGGLAYWTGLLNSGSSIGAVTYQIVYAAFSQVGTADGLLVQNKVTVGEYFAISLASNDTALAATAYNLVTSAASSVVAAEAAITQGSGGTWALTTGIDTLVHGPFANFVGTVAAANQTLNAGDTITGVGAGNVLKVVDTTNAASTPMAGVALTGVQELQVQAANVAGNASVYNIATTTGVTRVNSANSLGSGVTFSGLSAGTEVMVSGSASVANNVTNYAYTTASSTPTVTFNGGVTSQTIRVAAGAGVSTATSAVINSIGGTNGTTSAGAQASNTVNLTTGATLTGLTVHALTNLDTVVTAGNFAAAGAALVVDGAAGAVNLGDAGVYKTIDASGLTGGLTVNLSTQTTSFKGAQGNDNVTAGAVATVIAATASIDAGAGVDTIAASLVNAGNAAVFKNFEQLSVTGAAALTLDTSLMTNSTITGVVVDGAIGGNATLSNLVETASGFNVQVLNAGTAAAGNTTTLGFTAGSIAGTSDTLNVIFSGNQAAAATQAGTVAATGIEIVNINSAGTVKSGAGNVNAIVLTSDNLQTVNVTGGNATTVTVTDQANLAGATATALTTVNASALTKGFTFVQQAHAGVVGLTALTITGGTSNDNITVVTGQNAAGTVGVGDNVVLSSGGSDTVNVSGATLTSVATNALLAATSVTGSNAGDSLTFGANVSAFRTAATDVSAATDLLSALGIASGATAGSAALAARAVDWFVYGGNTYVFQNTAGLDSTLTGVDTVVKLVGAHDLSGSTFTAGTATLVLGG